jgi:multiple sugar transport system permease protein
VHVNRVIRMGVRQLAVAVALTGLYAYLLLPFAWLVFSSVQPEKALRSVPPAWVRHGITLQNYASILNADLRRTLHISTAAAELPVAVLRSFVIASWVMVLNLAVASPAAYAFSRTTRRGLNIVFVGILVSRMVPAVALTIPFYLIIRGLGLLNSMTAVVLGHLTFTLPLSVWLLRGYFDTLPAEVEDSARIDGCTRWQVLWHIGLPLVLPGLMAAGALAFMFSWNEFFFALVLTGTGAARTIPVVVALIGSDIMLQYGIMAASGVLAVIPPVVLAMVFSRYLRSGLLAGALR